MGACLQQNNGKEWGPGHWKEMTGSSPIKIYTNTAAECSAKTASKEKKRKASKEVVTNEKMLTKEKRTADTMVDSHLMTLMTTSHQNI